MGKIKEILLVILALGLASSVALCQEQAQSLNTEDYISKAKQYVLDSNALDSKDTKEIISKYPDILSKVRYYPEWTEVKTNETVPDAVIFHDGCCCACDGECADIRVEMKEDGSLITIKSGFSICGYR